jgi:aminoglycoside phosphotransferase family enzyme
MTEQQIHLLIQHCELPHGEVCQELIETHISWIILGKDYAFKLKKPLKLSFLDFSTLEKRKYYCEQELVLNQRLTHDVYLDVCPIWDRQGVYSMTTSHGEIVDYAVMMRRLDNSREMSKLLFQGKVSEADMEKIARQLVYFHKNTEVVRGVLTPEVIKEDFNDILQIKPLLEAQLGLEACAILDKIIFFSDAFINAQSTLIKERDRQGFTRDCHGDLHSGNIFLQQEPVIFDCIEFNPHLRTIDIFGELGFFCMDLEFYHRSDLSDSFLEFYNKAFPVITNEQEKQLFLYYKMYRANVKAKINAIKTQQAHNDDEMRSRLGLFQTYFQLMQDYHLKLSTTQS